MRVVDRFVVTGSGRCGTRYMSELLTAAGVPCGHELAYNASHAGRWPAGMTADSSWMAAAQLDAVDVPVVLLVRHPLSVVKSWVEIGFFGIDFGNPTHGPLRKAAPWIYAHEHEHDRALGMWWALTYQTLRRAEMVIRLERLDTAQLGRLLRWCGADPAAAGAAFAVTRPTNRHEQSRANTGIRWELSWQPHEDDELVGRSRKLARYLGYDPDEVPGG